MGVSAPLEVAHFKKVSETSPLPSLCPLPSRRPLSLVAGVKLLEILAEHVHMSSGSFINIRWGRHPGGTEQGSRK